MSVDDCERGPYYRAQDWATVRKAVYGAGDADGVANLKYAESVLLPLALSRAL